MPSYFSSEFLIGNEKLYHFTTATLESSRNFLQYSMNTAKYQSKGWGLNICSD